MPGSPPRYVFLSLLPDPASLRAVALLEGALNPAAGASVVAAPVRGLTFLSARGAVARQLDGWWERNVPPDARPVMLLFDEPGLEPHLSGMDSELVIGVSDQEGLARYGRFANAHVVVTDDPVILAEHTIATFACFRPDETDGAAGAGEQAATTIFMPRLQPRTPSRGAPRMPAQAAPPQQQPQQPQPEPERALSTTLSDPFTELSAVPPLADTVRPDRRLSELSRASLFSDSGSGASSRVASRLGVVGRLLVRRRTITIPREIGDLVLGLHPPPLIVVPARKGGVGKTVTAGAVAQVVGYALGDTTGSAAIVDQNIGNPDQWGRLDIPQSAGTVRQLMAALSSGLELPPTPAWAKTPALAVYPEDRASVDAYPPGLIQRFVHQLRERHVFLVVDLPNRLPDFTTAEAAICASYIELADLVILPTTDDPSALLGVLEYLETPSMRGKLVVVSYIVSTDRQLRRHRVVMELLDEIRKRVVAIEMIPKSEKATLAIVKGVSILDISPKLRDAYIRVAHTAVRALTAAG